PASRISCGTRAASSSSGCTSGVAPPSPVPPPPSPPPQAETESSSAAAPAATAPLLNWPGWKKRIGEATGVSIQVRPDRASGAAAAPNDLGKRNELADQTIFPGRTGIPSFLPVMLVRSPL